MKISSSEKCSYQEAATWLLNKFNRTHIVFFLESPGKTAVTRQRGDAGTGPAFPRCWREDYAMQALRSAAELGRPHDGILKPLSRLGGVYGFHPESLSSFLTRNGINAAEPLPATDATKLVHMEEKECQELRQRLVRLAAETDRLRAKLQEAETARLKAEERAAADADPSDLPDELDCALMALRAIRNGYGTETTPRKRIVEWLAAHRPDLTDDARKRIATVANPDKATGRK